MILMLTWFEYSLTIVLVSTNVISTSIHSEVSWFGKLQACTWKYPICITVQCLYLTALLIMSFSTLALCSLCLAEDREPMKSFHDDFPPQASCFSLSPFSKSVSSEESQAESDYYYSSLFGSFCHHGYSRCKAAVLSW